MDALDFQFHLEEAQRLFGERAEERFLRERACEGQNLYVFNPLRDLATTLLTVATGLRSEEARNYLVYGAARRLTGMWYSFRSLTFGIQVRRTTPLTQDEGRAFNRDLNHIYANVMGVLDNYAWAFLAEKEPDKLEVLRGTPMKIGLFASATRRDSPHTAFWKKVDAFAEWNGEVSGLRNPVVHRIPLHIPGALLTEAEMARRDQMEAEHLKLVVEGKYDEAEAMQQVMEGMGVFQPYITHHPREKVQPLYPTLAEDMKQVIRLQEVVLEELRKQD